MLKNTENVDDQCRTSRMVAFLYWRLNLQVSLKRLQHNVGQAVQKETIDPVADYCPHQPFCFKKISAFWAHSLFSVLSLM